MKSMHHYSVLHIDFLFMFIGRIHLNTNVTSVMALFSWDELKEIFQVKIGFFDAYSFGIQQLFPDAIGPEIIFLGALKNLGLRNNLKPKTFN
jgi:hypothetical protein